MKRAFLLFSLLFGCTLGQCVELGILTNGGFVAFTVDDDWPVVSMQTHLPVAVAAFQIPNPSDEGTSDSTNLSISLLQVDAEEGKAMLAKIGAPYGTAAPRIEKSEGWMIFRQVAMQGSTPYSVVDARKDVADVVVGVRLAWPHLANNPPDYDQTMNQKLAAILSSIRGKLGKYEPKNDEVIWRRQE